MEANSILKKKSINKRRKEKLLTPDSSNRELGSSSRSICVLVSNSGIHRAKLRMQEKSTRVHLQARVERDNAPPPSIERSQGPRRNHSNPRSSAARNMVGLSRSGWNHAS